MPAEEAGEEPADVEPIQLTPKQRERALEAPRMRWSAPTIKFDVGNMAGLSKIIADATNVNRVIADAMKPFLAVQDARAKHFKIITSDSLKAHAACEAQFAKLSAHLTKNVDFGLSQTVAKIAQRYAAQQAALLTAGQEGRADEGEPGQGQPRDA
jgi:hypothetical protein